MPNEITLPELMPPQSDRSHISFRKRRALIPLSIRLIFAVSVICTVTCALFIFVALGRSDPKLPDPDGAPAPITDTEATNALVSESCTEESTVPETIPVVLPYESEEITEPVESSEQKETEPHGSSAETIFILPEGAFPVKEVTYPTERAKLVNYTAHSFDTDLLEVMASAVITPSSDGPAVLVISSHTSECYLPEGAKYYHPNEHKTHSTDPEQNMTAVARAFCETLRSFGIGAVHVTSPCDLQGSNRAYINARNEITKIIAENPSIKYVIDVERATDTNGASELLRTSVSLGNKSYAPIRLTVSGGGSLEYMRICQNLSFALRLNGLVAEQSASLTRPVQIADAVYTDGNSPRNLKIEIGSYTSTLDEAVSSAELLAELFSLLLGS